MNLLKKLAFLSLALFVVVGFTAQNAEAGAFDGAKILLDLQAEPSAANDAKTNDGVTTIPPVAAGETVLLQLFLDSGAGNGTIGWDIKIDDTGNTFSDHFTVSSMSGIVNQLGVGANSATAGNIAASTVGANLYLGTITLTAKLDIPEGVTFALLNTTVITDGAFATDALDITSATFTFQTPAGPGLAAAPALAEIPRGGSVSSVVTLSNIVSGDAIDWTVTKDSGAATVAVAGQSSLSFSTTATATSDAITVEASGGGSATVTVAASVGGTAVDPSVTIVFSEQVPAELAAFGGEILESGVRVNWTTTSQTNNAGWRVMRSTDNVSFVPVSELIPGAGTTDSVLPYSFFDQAPPQSEMVFYRLDQIDLDGTIHTSNVIEVILGARFLDLPTEFATNVYPNPFNPATTVSYDLPSEAAVSIVIYDALGQEVRRLVSEQKAAGRYTIQWDARDNLGRSVGSGVYIAKVEAGSYNSSQKMLLLK